MAYLRWSASPWYVYRDIDGGEGDAAVLVVWHECFFGRRFMAGSLRRAASAGQPDALHALLQVGLIDEPRAVADLESLLPAVAEFLNEVFNAGKIDMPVDVARRYRLLKRLVARAFHQPAAQGGNDATGWPRWVQWTRECRAIEREYPPPPWPSEVRMLIRERGRRTLLGETVSKAQDANERAQIDAAVGEWPLQFGCSQSDQEVE